MASKTVIRPILLNKGNRQLNLNDTDVGSYKQCLGLPTLLALLVYWKTGKFLYYLDELYGNELVFAFSFVSSNNTDIETTEKVYPTAHKVCV